MTTTYTVKLIREGNKQSLIIPQEFILSTTEFTLRQEDDKLILEPIPKTSLLKLLSSLDDLDEEFPDIEDGLLPLDDIEL
jgi:antitoxin VapB